MASKKLFLAAGLVGIGSGIYSYYKNNSGHSPIIRDLSNLQTLENKPKYCTSTKTIKGVLEVPNLNLTLYQFQNCPFSCKVRAFLNYSGIPYNVVEVNPFSKKQALAFSPVKKVPIVVADQNKILVDSSAIISILGTYLLNSPEKQTLEEVLKMYPLVSNLSEKDTNKNLDIENKYHLMFGDEPKSDAFYEAIKDEAKWREWADKKLIITITPNIYRSMSEARQAINYFDKVGNWTEMFSNSQRMIVLYPGTLAMFFLGKMLKRRHNLSGEPRAHIYKACNDWLKAIGKKRIFMGGSKPNLADLAVYGALNSIEGCDTFKDLLKHTKIGPWYYRVQDAVDSHMGANFIKEKSVKQS